MHDEFSSGRFRVVRRAENTGERNCQAVVFEASSSDIVVTIDADTVLQPDSIRTIVRRFEGPRVGAVYGFLRVFLLIPVRLFALATMRHRLGDARRQRRGRGRPPPGRPRSLRRRPDRSPEGVERERGRGHRERQRLPAALAARPRARQGRRGTRRGAAAPAPRESDPSVGGWASTAASSRTWWRRSATTRHCASRSARAHGVETVAVHVGDDETIEILEDLRIDFAAGFFIGTRHR